MSRLAGKVAIVTGAGSGIGRATAIAFSEQGATVVATDLDEASARETAALLSGEGIALQQDVTSEEGWVSVTDTVLERFGRLNVTVNGAGISIVRTFPSETTIEQFRQVMGVNMEGVFLGTKHSLAAMQRSDEVNGSIINVSSVAGLVAIAGLAPYSASKGGVRLYSKSVAVSCAEGGVNVRCNSIHPGFIDTPMVQQAKLRIDDPAEAQKLYDDLQPLGRLGRPEDIAWGAVYLASDESAFMTGAELVIDGGYTAR